MGIFQETLDRAFRDVPAVLAAETIRAKLAEKGITLSESEVERLGKRLAVGSEAPITLRRNWFVRSPTVEVEWTDEDSANLREQCDEIFECLPGLALEIADNIGDLLLGTLRKKWPAQHRKNRKEAKIFGRSLVHEWSEPLSKLEMLIEIAKECGQQAFERCIEDDSDSQSDLTEVLFRLHARACRVSSEIVTLLHAGFADGAMARWRTLHEIAVTALFIAKAGEETAERYKAHEIVEERNALLDYQRCCTRLGYEPPSHAEIAEAEDAFREVIEQFGSPFRRPYGWAANVIKNKAPTFRDIEEHASLEHLRAHFRMASHNVHANPKGVFLQLGLLTEEDVLLTGPSVYGLADPGSATASQLPTQRFLCSICAPAWMNLSR